MNNSKQKKIFKGLSGRWNKTEHQRFMKALHKYGKDWAKIQQIVKTRTLSQVRSHAQKVFLKMSEQDISSMIGDEINYEYSNNSNESQFQQTEIIQEKNQQKQKRRQINLVQAFMNAFQQITKQQEENAGAQFLGNQKSECHQKDSQMQQESQSQDQEFQYKHQDGTAYMTIEQ